MAERKLASFFKGKNILITGGLGFIGSTLAYKLVKFGAKVTIIDSLIPEYGGNPFNIHGIEDKVKVNPIFGNSRFCSLKRSNKK